MRAHGDGPVGRHGGDVGAGRRREGAQRGRHAGSRRRRGWEVRNRRGRVGGGGPTDGRRKEGREGDIESAVLTYLEFFLVVEIEIEIEIEIIFVLII